MYVLKYCTGRNLSNLTSLSLMLRLCFVLAICANQFFFWLIVAFFHPYLFIYSVIYLFIYLFIYFAWLSLMVPVTNFRIYQKRKWFSKILFNKSRFIGRTCPFPFIVAQFSWLFYADATHLSTDSLSGAVPLFLCSCYTRSQGPLIFSRWTLHFVVSFWVIDEPFS